MKKIIIEMQKYKYIFNSSFYNPLCIFVMKTSLFFWKRKERIIYLYEVIKSYAFFSSIKRAMSADIWQLKPRSLMFHYDNLILKILQKKQRNCQTFNT